jgi:hypothetical protein
MVIDASITWPSQSGAERGREAPHDIRLSEATEPEHSDKQVLRSALAWGGGGSVVLPTDEDGVRRQGGVSLAAPFVPGR